MEEWIAHNVRRRYRDVNVYLRISVGLKCRAMHRTTITDDFVDAEHAFDSVYPFARIIVDVDQAFDSVPLRAA